MELRSVKLLTFLVIECQLSFCEEESRAPSPPERMIGKKRTGKEGNEEESREEMRRGRSILSQTFDNPYHSRGQGVNEDLFSAFASKLKEGV